jgi:MoxR-like ATPase
VIEPHVHEPDTHPLATVSDRVDGEEIARQLDAIAAEIKSKSPSLATIARLREQLADLADRSAWLADDAARGHLADRVGDLLKRLA